MKFDWQQNGNDFFVNLDAYTKGEVIASQWDGKWIGLVWLGREPFRQKYVTRQKATDAVENFLRKHENWNR